MTTHVDHIGTLNGTRLLVTIWPDGTLTACTHDGWCWGPPVQLEAVEVGA